jgi:hypothetical protein
MLEQRRAVVLIATVCMIDGIFGSLEKLQLLSADADAAVAICCTGSLTAEPLLA